MQLKSLSKTSIPSVKSPVIIQLPDTLFAAIPKGISKEWPDILLFLQNLLSKNPKPIISYQLLYENIEWICRNRLERALFSNITDFFDNFFEEKVQILASEAENPALLDLIAGFWSCLTYSFPILSGVFRYFESSYLRAVLRYKSLENWILTRLAQILKKKNVLKANIIQETLILILFERDSQLMCRETLFSAMKLIQAIPDFYGQAFEHEFLKLTESYYKAEADKWLNCNTLDLRNYLKYVERRFLEEGQRVRTLLEVGTNGELMKILENELIINHLEKILDSSFAELVQQKDLESLQRIYSLLVRVNKLEFLRKAWGFSIKERGKNLVLTLKEGLFEAILLFRKDLMQVVKESFEGNKALKTAIDTAFESFLNISPNNAAEMASKQFDLRLRKRVKVGIFDEEVAKKDLDDLFEIFRYLGAKDIFEEFYTRRLAKRLFFGGISSMEMERHVLEKLKFGKNFFFSLIFFLFDFFFLTSIFEFNLFHS